MASTVLFQTSAIVPGLSMAVDRAREVGATVMLDAYHAFGVVPFRVSDVGAGPAFWVAGGYKYAQWGEGVCFMIVPDGCSLRPVYTGWFSDFGSLEEPVSDAPLGYGVTPADRFAGSTYDPTSHYRARAVVELFDRQGWTVEALRALSLRQTQRLLDGLGGYEVLTPRDPHERAGFVAIRVSEAGAVVASLRERGVFTDSRGDILRLGPAPFVTDEEIDQALLALRGVSPPAA
jgi:selenocysteine lyase/cysteine desulfurase